MNSLLRCFCLTLVLALALSIGSPARTQASSSPWSVFVPPAPANTWRVQAFRSPGWGPDPQDHIPGNSKLWGRTLRIESRDFALVSMCRLSRQLLNAPMPYWPGTSFLWFRAGETEVPHMISVSCRDEGAAQPQDLPVAPYGPYYVSRLTPEKVACKMLGRAGSGGTPSNMPSFVTWPKFQVTWDYLMNVSSNSAVLKVMAINATGTKLDNVDVTLSFYLGPEFGDVKLKGSSTSGWIPAAVSGGDFTSCAAWADGMHSGLAVTADSEGTLQLVSGPRYGRSIVVHFRSASVEPGAAAGGSVLAQALSGDGTPGPAAVKVPHTDFSKLQWTPQSMPVRLANGRPQPKPQPFSLRKWIADLARPKVRGVVQEDNTEAVFQKWVDKYAEAHQNLLIAGLDPGNSKQYIDYARQRGMKQVWTGGDAAQFKDLPRDSQPDGFGQDNDAPLWSNLANPSRSENPDHFAAQFGHGITEASREELVRYYSGQFADYWRQFESSITASVPGAIPWFYGQLEYQAGRFPLNTDAMCKDYCQELARVAPDLHMLYFYYGTDDADIENQVHIAKSAGMKHVYFMPMSYFCARPGDITGNLEAAWAGGADGVFLFTADWAQDWQFSEWSLASQTYFPTPELPAFVFTRDLQGLVRAISTASDVRVVYKSGLSRTSDQAVTDLRLILARRAGATSHGKPITIQVGPPDALSGSARAKAQPVLADCKAAGLPDDRGYVLPFSDEIWVGGATPEACERALGMALDLAQMATFGDECVPFKHQETDAVYYP